MNARRCCQASAAPVGLFGSSTLKRVCGALEWVLPGAIFVAVPKCPACVAAYIALATGVGVSLTAAEHLRLLVLTLCIGALGYFALRRAAALVLWIQSRRGSRNGSS
jgi:hypothetical protein